MTPDITGCDVCPSSRWDSTANEWLCKYAQPPLRLGRVVPIDRRPVGCPRLAGVVPPRAEVIE